MKYKLSHIFPSDDFLTPDNTRISFKKFIDFLEKKAIETTDPKAKVYRFALKHFKKFPQLAQSININELKNYRQILDLLEALLLPNFIDEETFGFALGVPTYPIFFLTTKIYRHLIETRIDDEDSEDIKKMFYKRRMKIIYQLILERFYNFKPLISDDIVHTRKDNQTRLLRYFNLNIDNRFVEVKYDGNLPEININIIQQYLMNGKSFEELQKLLPIDKITFSGFSLVTAKDITPAYVLHNIRNTIIKHNPADYNETYKTVIGLLKQLFGVKDIEVGLLPFVKVNDKLVSYHGKYAHSILINLAEKLQITEEDFLEWINFYFQNPRVVVKKQFSNDNTKSDELYKAFYQSGFKEYAIIPVIYNTEVIGILELTSKNKYVIDTTLLNHVDMAIPILGQLMYQSQTEFTAYISRIIEQNFTTIQPSVQWKFNETAWNYVKSSSNNSIRQLQAIRFQQVHPLYGSIDIRNSTIERNNALRKDMHNYLLIVKKLLTGLHVQDKNLTGGLLLEIDDALEQTERVFTGNEESLLNTFKERIEFYLDSVDKSGQHNKNHVIEYYKKIDKKSGNIHLNRQALENSMQLLNSFIIDYLDKLQEQIHKEYPVYFERIRTDGVEYDMYLGECISPQQPYKEIYLHELRLLQLKSMAGITKLVNDAAGSLPIPLQTTQLIYVNAAPINIAFRMDERRFDAEGSYSIRYHIIKKRIDKVRVLNTGERLTQPAKIAIVYTMPHQENEYTSLIKELQKENILKENIELFDLEELQGVTGLKAIRVEVNFD